MSAKRDCIKKANYLLGLDRTWPPASAEPFTGEFHPTTVAEYYHNFDKAFDIAERCKAGCLQSATLGVANMHKYNCIKRKMFKDLECNFVKHHETLIVKDLECKFMKHCETVGGGVFVEHAQFWESVINELTSRKRIVEAIPNMDIPLSTIMAVTVRVNPVYVDGPYLRDARR